VVDGCVLRRLDRRAAAQGLVLGGFIQGVNASNGVFVGGRSIG
jgi:hypothetical protein